MSGGTRRVRSYRMCRFYGSGADVDDIDLKLRCVARAVELRVAEIQHDVDADHGDVRNIKPCGPGERAGLLPGPDLAVEAEAVADDDEDFEHDAFALRGAGADGFRDVEGPGGTEDAEHDDFAKLCDVDHREHFLSVKIYTLILANPCGRRKLQSAENDARTGSK